MGDSNEKRSIRSSSSSKEMINLSLQVEKYPRDLLQRFMSSESQASTRSEVKQEEEEEEEVQLNLGLSLGGRFGVDKNPRKLIRSSSIAGSIPIFREDDANTPPPVSYPTLLRTSSLPTETEEEWRKRKELQALRRMEAKRRRSEKQRGSREDDKQLKRANSIGLQSWAAAARQVILGGGSEEVVGVKGKGGASRAGFSLGSVQLISQGSVESQGGSCSSMSEMENKSLQVEIGDFQFRRISLCTTIGCEMRQTVSSIGHMVRRASSCGEAGSSGSIQFLQDRGNQEIMKSSGTKTSETCRTPGLEVENKGKERGNAMEDMPCVFTKGEGPNGKRIEGILYKYGKGEEVRIMCVCHGNFLSPAEFVKHAGGGDVDNPLRHIVINPSSASFL